MAVETWWKPTRGIVGDADRGRGEGLENRRVPVGGRLLVSPLGGWILLSAGELVELT